MIGDHATLTHPQGDSTQRWVKDLDVMLGAESAVLILDDTEGVWPRHAANLVHVRALTLPLNLTVAQP